jgi:hypothetical protein
VTLVTRDVSKVSASRWLIIKKQGERVMEIGGIAWIVLALLVGWFWTTKGRSFWFGLL